MFGRLTTSGSRVSDYFNPSEEHKIFGNKTLLLLSLFYCVLIGLMIPLFPWWFTVAFILSPVLMIGIFKFPFIGLLLWVPIVFNAIPLWMFPEIPAPGGRMKISDFLVILMAMVAVIKYFSDKKTRSINFIQVLWPLCVLLLFLMVSLVYGKLIKGNEAAVSEARNHISWLILPVLIIIVDSAARLKVLVRVLLLTGVVVAIYVILQSAFQIQIMGGRVESLDMRQNQDITRSTAGGGAYIIAFSLFYMINSASARKLPWLFVVPTVLILCAGLGATFGRGIWVATSIGFIISSMFHRGIRGLLLSLTIGVIAVGGLVAATSIAKPRVAEAIMARAIGIGDEIDSGGSFHHRRVENQEALKTIVQHPFFGVGMGGEYKQVLSSVGAFEIETRYIHNSFLYFPLKMGVLAALVPLLFVSAFVSAILKNGWYRKLDANSKYLPAATIGAFVVPLITSYTQPEWASAQGIAAISLLFSMVFLDRNLRVPNIPTSA